MGWGFGARLTAGGVGTQLGKEVDAADAGAGAGDAARGGLGGEELEAERGLQRRREQALLAQMARLEAEVARLRSERAGEGAGAGPGAPGAGARAEEPGGAARRGSSGSGGARQQAEVVAMAAATGELGDAGEGEAASSAGETEASGRSDGRAWGEPHARAVSVHWDEVCATPATPPPLPPPPLPSVLTGHVSSLLSY